MNKQTDEINTFLNKLSLKTNCILVNDFNDKLKNKFQLQIKSTLK